MGDRTWSLWLILPGYCIRSRLLRFGVVVSGVEPPRSAASAET
jgi:hypothetical protein